MGARELFRFLEVEAHRPREPRPLDSFLPRPEEWPSQLDAEEEKVYKVTDEDVAGLNLEGSVSLEEILNEKIPDAPRAAATAAGGGADDEEEEMVTAEEIEEMGLGGSVSLDELLGEDAPTRPSAPTKPAGESVDALAAAKKDLSLDELLDEMVPDQPKPKKKK